MRAIPLLSLKQKLKYFKHNMIIDKSKSTAGVVRVGSNLPGNPLETRSIANDCKLDHSIEYN